MKRHPSGHINKFKARLCVRGDLQQHGLNYWETYSPVVQWSTVCLCLVLAHEYNLITHQCNYSNAYCQSTLDEDLYMEIPARFCCDVRTQNLFRSKHAQNTIRALNNRDGILKNDVFIEAVRCILGTKSHSSTLCGWTSLRRT